MAEFVWGLVCLAALFGAFLLVFKLISGPRRKEIETLQRSVRDLSHRLHAVEKRLDDGSVAAPAPTKETPAVREPAPTPVRPAPHRAERPLPRIEPPPRRADEPLFPPPLPSVAPTVNVAPSAPSERVLRTAPTKPAVSLETFLGGRVMLIAGAVVLLLGVAFFLKYAIDNDWIGPGLRIALGVATGGALLAVGDSMRPRGFDVFGQALMGIGLGAVYLSNYFACSHYDMAGPTAAFVLAALITALGAALALWRTAPVLAYLGFLGGYLAPWLLSKSSGDLVGLTLWLTVLDAGLLAVLFRRAWNGLDLLALAATSVYVGVWFSRSAARADVGVAGACLAALTAASLALGLVPSIVRRARPTGQSLLGVAAAGALATLAGHELLFPAHRWELGVGVLVLGAAYFLASRLVARRVADGSADSDSLLGFSMAALATAVAVVASGNAVAPALSAVGLAVVYAGTRTRQWVLLACGVATIGLACGDLLLHRLDLFGQTATPFLNERFFVFACPCAALLAAGRMLAKVEGVAPETATLVGAAGLVVLPVVLAADLFYGFAPSDAFHREMRHFAPAAVLAVYGFLAARLFGRGSAMGRALAFVPVVLAVAFGVTLLFFGHVRPFGVLFNPTFAAGLLIVAAVRFAAFPSETGPRNALGVIGALFLLALVTAEIHAWGETTVLPMHGNRQDLQFEARNWIVIAWAAFAAVSSLAEIARRRKPLAWLLTGNAATERGIALIALSGAFVWHVGVHLDRHEVSSWPHGQTKGVPLEPFANLVFGGGLALVAAAHAVGRAPFDTLRRVVRLAGLACLLALVTIEFQWWAEWRTSRGDARVELDAVSWTTIAWAAFAAGIAWTAVARKVPAFRWLGIDDEVLERRCALVPLLGAVLWGIAAMLGGRPPAFPIVLNLAFASGLAVTAAAFAVAARSPGARDGLRVGALLWLLALLTAEIHHWGRTCDLGTGSRAEAEFRAMVWISVVWAVYAASLVAVGFARRQAPVRWLGLGVFALTIGKVVLFDMAQLEAVYRIGSFLALGALLVGASFLYQRARRITPPPSDPPGGAATG